MNEVIFDHMEFVKKAPKQQDLTEKKMRTFVDQRLHAKHQMDTIALENGRMAVK